jgi:acyl-CoA synthetase (AMP-forming)/AMP-acid ligase II
MALNSDARLSPYAFLDRPTDAPLLIDAGVDKVWTQAELTELIDATAEPMRTGRRDLVFNLCGGRDFGSVHGYLSGVRAGHAVAMLDGRVPADLTKALIDRYRPAFVMRSPNGRTLEVEKGPGAGEPVADDLLILLSTSGTTGSPKLARLSVGNIETHTASIVDYLDIDERERTMQSLPIHFSYGLSVLNTHLATGAPVILPDDSIIRPEFWEHAARWGATSFAGVPYSYAILERAKLLRTSMPETMHTLTQSGGRLAPESIVRLHELMSERDGRLFVMYGQTESTARMSYVPPDALPEKAHCVGVPIPGGSFSIKAGDEETTEPEVEGEVVYRGPNTMLGYAEQREDLELGDMLEGVLHTGDIGIIDSDGFLRLTGRTKRIAKVYGLRVSLDEVEAAANPYGLVAAVDGGDQIVLWRLSGARISADDMRRELAQRFNLKSQAFAVHDVDEFPLTGRDKVDYKALAKLSEA